MPYMIGAMRADTLPYPAALKKQPEELEKYLAAKRKELSDAKEYLGAIKKDGAWYTLEISDKEYLWARDESKKTPGLLTEKSANIPHIFGDMRKLVSQDTIVLGEIYYPGMKSNEVTKIMGSAPEKALIRQGLLPQKNPKKPEPLLGLIHYYIHDVLMWDGLDLRNCDNETRINFLTNHIAPTFEGHPFIEVAQYTDENLDALVDEAIANGEEGMVWKRKKGMYVPDKRPAWEWIKFKCEETHDVIITGFAPPTRLYTGKEIGAWPYWELKPVGDKEDYIAQDRQVAEFWNGDSLLTLDNGWYHRWHEDGDIDPVTKAYYNGWCGALEVAVMKDGELFPCGTIGSGMDEAMLQDIKDHPEKYLNQPIEITCMNTMDNGFRHGRFERMRPDLNLKDCDYYKIWKE